MLVLEWYQSTVVGVAYDPLAADITTGGGLYQVFVDVSQFDTADGYAMALRWPAVGMLRRCCRRAIN